MSTTVAPALEDLEAAVGSDALLTSDEDMDLAAEQYSFNDHACMRFCETINDALDPNGILAPGKSGIWPKAMRKGS
jgi:4-cresol dehydrogenase (hydroxylating)